jgi:hypothetical protein
MHDNLLFEDLSIHAHGGSCKDPGFSEKVIEMCLLFMAHVLMKGPEGMRESILSIRKPEEHG